MNDVQILYNQSILVGNCSREGLLSFPPFKAHYDVEYFNYQPETKLIEELKSMVNGLEVTVVLGTWCGDSLREVPRLLKVLDLLAIPENDITIIAVDQSKSIPEETIEKLQIERVPTIIIYKDGKEAGKIVETPIETFEKDILYLLNN
jgi:thiol-disulfide isomerase/thioredoxin